MQTHNGHWRFVLGFLVTVGGVAVAAAESWDMKTDDTEIRISVERDRPVVLRLAAAGAPHNWLERPGPVPLLSKVWVGPRETPTAWRFESGRLDAAAGGGKGVGSLLAERPGGCFAQKTPDPFSTRLTLRFANAEPRLALRSIWQARAGRGPVEHWLEIENLSGARLTVGHQDSLTLRGLDPGGKAAAWWIKRGGGNASTQGGTFEQPVDARLDLRLVSDCDDGASPVPWLAIQAGAQRGLYVGWEFSGLGRIHARAAGGRKGDGSLDLDVGLLPDFKTDVEPGETLLVPPAFVGCYRGDLDEGSCSLHRFVLEKLRPPLPKDVPDPILAYNLYLDVGGNTARQSDVLRSARFCRELGFEAFMPDAMWFPATGDWRWDPARFPSGVRPIEEYVHGAGMRLALWCAWTNGGVSSDPGAMSVRGPAGRPEWFQSDFAPDWQPGPFYGGRLCLGSPEARQWAIEKTQWLVRRHKLDYLKHDIGPIVTRCNKSSHRHRHGTDAAYWAAMGYYEVQEKLLRAFPGLILENCSGGGHIKDFGVARRTHYTVTTDTLSNLPNRQSLYDSTFALPPLVLQAYTYDNYYPVRGDQPGTFLWRSAMMGAWQIDPTDTPTWTEHEKGATRRSVAIYKEWVRPMLADVKVHHILPRPDGVRWDGMFYFSPSLRRGTLYLWRPDSPDAKQAIRLKGLDRGRRYWLWCEDGSIEPGLRSGEDLMARGLDVRLAQPYTSDLIFVQDESLGKPAGLARPGEFRLKEAVVKGGMFSVSARFAWAPSAAAIQYRLQVSSEPDFRNVLAESPAYGTSAALENLPPGRALHWRVEAISWGGRRMSNAPAGAFITPKLDRPAGIAFLSELPWTKAAAGAGNPVRRDVNYYGKPISVGGKVCAKGLWTHAFPDATPADVSFDLAGKKYLRFKAVAGVDDSSGGGSVQFEVLVDGKKKAASPVLRPRQSHRFDIDVAGAREITLRVTNGGDGYSCDHAAWGLARFVEPGVRDPLDTVVPR